MKYSKVVIAFGLVMLVAACGSHARKSTTPPAAHAATTATTPAPDLKGELLSTSDLPAGWSVIPNTTSGARSACFGTVRSALDLNAAAQAQVSFVYTSNRRLALQELLAYLPGRGHSSMTAASRAISGCGRISLTSNGLTLAGIVRPVAFPAVADQSSAYQLSLTGTLSGQAVTLGFDVVLFRKGDTVATIQYIDIGTPLDITALQHIIQHAAAKIS